MLAASDVCVLLLLVLVLLLLPVLLALQPNCNASQSAMLSSCKQQKESMNSTRIGALHKLCRTAHLTTAHNNT
jgi:hypothetical protein